MASRSDQRRSDLQSTLPAFRWRSLPLRDEPRQGLVLLGFVLLGSSAVLLVMADVWLAILAAILIALSFSRMWIPAAYELDSRGFHMTVFRRRRLPWHMIRACKLREDGLVLVVRSDRSSSGGVAVYVPWNSHRAEVVAVLRYYLAAAIEDEPAAAPSVASTSQPT